jgi:SET domain-containing protein
MDSDESGEPWLSSNVVVRASLIDGRGLFARAPIAAGEALGGLGSRWVVMTDDEFRSFVATTVTYDAMALGDGRHVVSMTSRAENPVNFVNHRCEPNAVLQGLVLYAGRDITTGEEVAIDYATISTTSWSMRCRCGSDACREIVTGLVD